MWYTLHVWSCIQETLMSVCWPVSAHDTRRQAPLCPVTITRSSCIVVIVFTVSSVCQLWAKAKQKMCTRVKVDLMGTRTSAKTLRTLRGGRNLLPPKQRWFVPKKLVPSLVRSVHCFRQHSDSFPPSSKCHSRNWACLWWRMCSKVSYAMHALNNILIIIVEGEGGSGGRGPE